MRALQQVKIWHKSINTSIKILNFAGKILIQTYIFMSGVQFPGERPRFFYVPFSFISFAGHRGVWFTTGYVPGPDILIPGIILLCAAVRCTTYDGVFVSTRYSCIFTAAFLCDAILLLLQLRCCCCCSPVCCFAHQDKKTVVPNQADLPPLQP